MALVYLYVNNGLSPLLTEDPREREIQNYLQNAGYISEKSE